MLKKLFLAASICAALACPTAIFAQQDQPAGMTDVAEPQAGDAEGDVVAELPCGQAEIVADDVPSAEPNTVVESEIARKMKQAEKAKNVEENDSWGGAITIIAMCIVVGALIVLSLLFNIFGKISEKLLSKKKLEAHGKSIEDVDDDHEHVDSGEVIAAISAALAEHFNDQHDVEDYILTIRRMRRAYSPWNSKIYNLRHNPELTKNPARPIPVTKNIK
ncbi:MAG: OadG family protein [Muribaculaceae bacterium]|nr:OadG family protein [Muribaculaceae bacterium]MDE6330227.1 OadG family protein [Muribaculaceae bacterium]